MVINIKPTDAKMDGRIVQFDLEFRPGVKVRETVDFVRDDGVRLYIDVDTNDVPIAIEVVHPDNQPVEYVAIQSGDDEQARLHCMELFAFASQMVSLGRMAKGMGSLTLTDHRIDPVACARFAEPSRRMLSRLIRSVENMGAAPALA
jgi:hypothetical protein